MVPGLRGSQTSGYHAGGLVCHGGGESTEGREGKAELGLESGCHLALEPVAWTG